MGKYYDGLMNHSFSITCDGEVIGKTTFKALYKLRRDAQLKNLLGQRLGVMTPKARAKYIALCRKHKFYQELQDIEFEDQAAMIVDGHPEEGAPV